jgi:hypothetical protein
MNLISLIKKKIQQAEKDLENAQQRLTTWKAALELEMREQDESASHSVPMPPVRRISILSLAEEALGKFGPLSNADIQRYLRDKGVETTTNSINTSLSRLRPEKFDKDDEHKWYLVASEEHP